jgi:hypothetical protein
MRRFKAKILPRNSRKHEVPAEPSHANGKNTTNKSKASIRMVRGLLGAAVVLVSLLSKDADPRPISISINVGNNACTEAARGQTDAARKVLDERQVTDAERKAPDEKQVTDAERKAPDEKQATE